MRLRLATWFCLVALPVCAQEKPRMLPQRDVDVTYRSLPGGTPIEQRSRFDAQTQRMRLDTPTPGVYMIVDYRTRVASLVSDSDRGVLEMQAPGMLGTNPDARYQRLGTDKVAGIACTEWQTVDSQGLPSIACFTEDGVLLRARRGNQVMAVAVRVAYAANDPALFTVPPGYNRVAGRKP